MKKFILMLLCSLPILIGCTNHKKDSKPDILLSNIDTTVLPSDDFFQYANGGWIQNNPIPNEEKSWGIDNLVQNEIYSRLKAVNEKAKLNRNDDINRKIAEFWESALDTAEIEKQGLIPIEPYLSEISAINNVSNIIKVTNELRTIGVICVFDDRVWQDFKNNEIMAYYLRQGGLGLPDRDYYFKTDNRNVHIQNDYIKHIEKTFLLYRIDSLDARNQSYDVYNLEKKLALYSRKLEYLRDPYLNYNKFSKSDLEKLTPLIDWNIWFSSTKINWIDSVVVAQPDFFKGLNKLLKETPINTWRSYLTWHLLRTFSPFLNYAFVKEDFNFFNAELFGSKEIRPRWKRVLDAQEAGMGELLGQAYVKEYFNENAKIRYSSMVELIKEALKNRIQNLTWMSDSTKLKAIQKLTYIKKKVGYPDKWKDFSALLIDDKSYSGNIMNCNSWWRNYNLSKLGKPVNRDEWLMTPQTYNAYYNSNLNEIVLPAAAFTVPGFSDEELDDALVYGYAGCLIGHEITHGFDDRGRQFDQFGNLKQWWTKSDEEKFKLRGECLVKQYNSYMPVDTMHINGKATLGENIADLGGVLISWDAFTKTEQYKLGRKVAGLSPAQRFFLGYALNWMMQVRKEALAVQLLSNFHSPQKYRVNGPLVNVDAFYEVFHIKPGDKIYIPDSLRTRIW